MYIQNRIFKKTQDNIDAGIATNVAWLNNIQYVDVTIMFADTIDKHPKKKKHRLVYRFSTECNSFIYLIVEILFSLSKLRGALLQFKEYE